jgi:hypothetical protein
MPNRRPLPLRILVVDDYADTADGGGGRDVLIGGRGGDDILIAGTTAYDGNVAAPHAVRAEWSRARPFAPRLATLAAGVGPGGGVKLGAGTVFDDTATDLLTGASGSDWFLLNGAAGRSTATDRVTGDLMPEVGTV